MIKFNRPWHVQWEGWEWYVGCSEYVSSINGKSKYNQHYLHRWIMKAKDNEYVDHKEILKTLDNRKSNLRISTNGENTRNKNGANRNSNTGVRNVNYIPSENKYWVQIMKDGIRYHWTFKINQFEEACKFAEEKRKELFGEFAGNSIRKK